MLKKRFLDTIVPLIKKELKSWKPNIVDVEEIKRYFDSYLKQEIPNTTTFSPKTYTLYKKTTYNFINLDTLNDLGYDKNKINEELKIAENQFKSDIIYLKDSVGEQQKELNGYEKEFEAFKKLKVSIQKDLEDDKEYVIKS